MKINPVGKMCVIKVDEAPTEVGGLTMSHSSNTAAGKVKGVLTEVGELSAYKDKIGRTVLFRRYSVDDQKFIDKDGVEKTVSLIHDDEILAFPDFE